MSLRNIGIVYRKELVDSLRDRRTLISMIVVPLLVMPLLTIGMGVLSIVLVGAAMKEAPKVMILGGQDSPNVVADLKQLKDLQIVPAKPDFADEISNKQIRAAVEIPPRFEANLASGESSTVNIYMYEGELKSGFGADRLQRFFRELRDHSIREQLQARHLPESLTHPFDILEKNVAPPGKSRRRDSGRHGSLLPDFIVSDGSHVSGHGSHRRRKGTRHDRNDSVQSGLAHASRPWKIPDGADRFHRNGNFGDHLDGHFLGAGRKMLLGVTHGAAEAALQITITGKAMVSIFLVVLPLAVFFSAALLALSLFAKSFKEAQSYISPLMIVVFMPAVAALLPGVELNAALALIPVLNTSLVSKEIITGTYHWNLIALIFLSSSVYAGIAIAIAVKLFQREDVLFRS